MIELHLVGYTAELGHLVLDLATAQGGRYRLVVDADLFATVDELRERRREAGLPVGDLAEFAEELGLPAEAVAEDDDADDPWEDDEPTTEAEPEPEPESEPEPQPEPDPEPEPEPDEEAEPEPAPEPEPEPVPQPEPVVEPAAWDFEEGADSDGASMPEDDAPWSVRVVDPPPPTAPPDEDDDIGVVARLLDERAPEPPADTSSEPSVDTPPEPPVETPPEPPAVASTEEHGPRPPRPLLPGRRPRSRDESTSPPPRPAARRPEPALSPAEIQSRLRAGTSVRSVAKAAGVDEEWIRRWEVPILAERGRVLDQARGLRLERPRLGRSRLPLGQAVDRALAGRGVSEDDVTWEVSRRRRDGRWRITVRYVWRGRRRSATWLYDAEDGSLTAASDTARDLGFVRRRR